jgi:hypothetical protein
LMGGSYAVGRYMTPPDVKEVVKVEVQEKIVEVEKQVVVVQDRIVYLEKKNNNIKTETTTTTNPDGSSTTHTVTTDTSTTDIASSRETDTTATKETTKEVARESSTEKTVEVSSAKPQWRLGGRLEGGALLLGPVVPVVSVGIQAERRIIGPFFMGLSATVDMGVSLAGVTGPYSVKGGITLGAEF